MIGIHGGIPGSRRKSGLEIGSLQNFIVWMLPSRDARRCDFNDNFTFSAPIPDDEVNLLLCERQQATDIFDMIAAYPPGGNIAPIGSGLGEGTSPIYRKDAAALGLDAIEFQAANEVLFDTSYDASEGDKEKIRRFHNGEDLSLSIAVKRTASATPFQEIFGTGGFTTLQAGLSIAVNGTRNTAELLITREAAGTYAYSTIADPLADDLVPVGQWTILTLVLQTTAPRIRFWINDTLVISAAPVSAFHPGNSATSVTFNSQGNLAAIVGEVAACGTGNSEADRDRQRAYMIRRWRTA